MEKFKAPSGGTCAVCRENVRKGSYVISYGGFYRHPKCAPAAEPVSDPAPTVDTADGPCEHPNGFTEHGCPCGASRPDDTVGDAFDDPTPLNSGPDNHGLADPEKGPWFGALYAGECSSLGCSIAEGDRIRADGLGGYECEDCGSFEDEPNPEQPLVEGWQTPASAVAKQHLAARAARTRDGIAPADTTHPGLRVPNVYQEQASAAAKRHLAAQAEDPTPVAAMYSEPTPEAVQDAMPFEDPTTPAERPKKINVSGQPEADRDWQGRYIVKDPDLGDFRWQKNGKAKGITRVTTFNKAARDTTALQKWGKRNVVIGASRRPDILRRAHGLVHEGGKEILDRIVAELDTAAGGKVSAEEGTYLHEETEFIDAGLKTWREAPPAYQQDLKRYVDALEENELEPVPGFIERTTMISEFGGVCGTFDRIFYHRPSGTYVVGDLKTGKTMEYAVDETETQLWCYAHGVNQNGVYDWNTKSWLPPGTYGDSVETGPWQVPTVREDVGVIIHMPVQGPEAGTVNVLKADLVAGKAHAELCHANRSRPKRKLAPWASWVAPEPTWEERFADVWTNEEATRLWRLAKDRGVEGVRLVQLIDIAREALAKNPGNG